MDHRITPLRALSPRRRRPLRPLGLLALALGLAAMAAAVWGPLARPALRAQASLPTLAPTARSTPLVPGSTLPPGGQGLVSAASATNTATPTGWSPSLDELTRLMEAAWNAQNWPEVLHLIDRIVAIDPNYGNIQERRYFAYVNYGYALMTSARCTEAQWAFGQALLVRPAGEEAKMGLELLGRYCPTPTPTTTGAGPTATPPWQPLTPTPTASAAPPSATAYVVQPGDTLYGLARRFGTTVQAIMTANGMTSTYLRAGQTITIPAGGGAAAGSPLVHIVQPGETLSSIAQAYNTTVWAIMSANGLTSHTIYAYRALFIPVAPAGGLTAHIVMPGETLYTIAQRYHTTVALLMMANNLTDYAIYVHQPLIIPPAGWSGWPPLAPGSHSRTHLVVPGDTLFGIARQYGVTVGALMSANGLSSSAIYAGDTLRIP